MDSIKILEPVIMDENFTKSGKLDKTKASAIPLIIYNGWKNEYEYTIGANILQENLSIFIHQSVIEEANRSTVLFADSIAYSELVLEIKVDSIGAYGLYRSEGYFLFLLFFYSYSFGESAGSGTAYSQLSYVLRENNDVILT